MSKMQDFTDQLYWHYWNYPERAFPVPGTWRQKFYWGTRRKKLRRIRSRKNPEPYLSLQTVIEKVKGLEPNRSLSRWEGRPRPVSHEDAVRIVASGDFTKPLVMTFGAPRSATTSLQNLVLTFFAQHVPPGPFSDYPYAKDLWYYPKHNPEIMRQSLGFPDDEVLSIFVVRDPLDSLASLAIFLGEDSEADAHKHADEWEEIARLSLHPKAAIIPFDVLVQSPQDALAWVLDRTDLTPTLESVTPTSWIDIHASGTNKDWLDNANRSNFPHKDRQQALPAKRDQVAGLLGEERLRELEYLYERVMAASSSAVPRDGT